MHGCSDYLYFVRLMWLNIPFVPFLGLIFLYVFHKKKKKTEKNHYFNMSACQKGLAMRQFCTLYFFIV